MIALAEAMKAQQALRAAAGLEPESFPVQAFVGMISDEVEALRAAGRTDAEIVALIRESSGIAIAEQELAAYYAGPEARHGHSQG